MPVNLVTALGLFFIFYKHFKINIGRSVPEQHITSFDRFNDSLFRSKPSYYNSANLCPSVLRFPRKPFADDVPFLFEFVRIWSSYTIK